MARDLRTDTPIGRARLGAGLEQQEAARLLGLSESTYRRLETGRMAKPPLSYLVNCAILFDVPIEALFDPHALDWSRIAAGTPKTPPRVQGKPRASRARLTDAPRS